MDCKNAILGLYVVVGILCLGIMLEGIVSSDNYKTGFGVLMYIMCGLLGLRFFILE